MTVSYEMHLSPLDSNDSESKVKEIVLSEGTTVSKLSKTLPFKWLRIRRGIFSGEAQSESTEVLQEGDRLFLYIQEKFELSPNDEVYNAQLRRLSAYRELAKSDGNEFVLQEIKNMETDIKKMRKEMGLDK